MIVQKNSLCSKCRGHINPNIEKCLKKETVYIGTNNDGPIKTIIHCLNAINHGLVTSVAG